MMMTTLRVNDIIKDRILVTRESAHVLKDAILANLTKSNAPPRESTLSIDFWNIEGMAPSFLDELIAIFESLVSNEVDGHTRQIVIRHPPTRLTSKFQAIGRGHKMTVEALSDGSWLFSTADAADSNDRP